MTANRVYSTVGSAALTVMIRWTDRGIGILSVAILARLLVPEDFGIIAMASLVVALADVLLNFGVHVPLIQNQQATQAHYDTAWTLRLLQATVSTAALLIVIPAAVDYFQDTRLEWVLRILAFSLLLGGLENIGLVDFQKNMQFGAEFRFRFLRRIIGFFTTILLAVALRSYWALVIGMLTQSVVGVVLSYRLHEMRPRISFAKFREIFSVSQWMLLYSIGRYLRQNLHRILVGRWEPTAVMGSYSIADEISSMPTVGVLTPVNRALFPAFAKARENPSRLKEMFLLAQGVQTMIAVPVAAGLALVAEEAVLVLLGRNWEAAVPFVQVLALINIAQALTTSGSYVLLVLAKTRMNALFIWIQVTLFGGLALTPLIDREAMDVARLRLVVAALGLSFLFWVLTRSFRPLRVREIVAASLRPLVAAVVMGVTLTQLAGVLQFPIAMALTVKILLGFLSYSLSILVLWSVAGRPNGAESYLFQKAVVAWEAFGAAVNRRLRS